MKKVLLLLVLFLGVSYGYVYQSGDTTVRVGEPPVLKDISACVLPQAKDKYTRVCMAGTRFVITKDAIGDYYIERAFSRDNPSGKCSCKLVDKALNKHYYEMTAAQRKVRAIEQERFALTYGQIFVGEIQDGIPKKTKVKRKVRVQKLGMIPVQVEDDRPFTAVKLPKEDKLAKPLGHDDGKVHFTCVKCQ